MGSVKNESAASRTLRIEVSSRKKMPTAASSPYVSSRRSAVLALVVLARHLGVVAERHAPCRSSLSSISSATEPRSRPSTLAPIDDRAGHVLAQDGARPGLDASHRRRPSAATTLPSGVSIGRFSMAVRLLRVLRRAPDVHVVGLAVPEDVADLLAGTYVAATRRTSPGFSPYRSAASSSTGHLDLGHVLDAARRSRRRRRRPRPSSP